MRIAMPPQIPMPPQNPAPPQNPIPPGLLPEGGQILIPNPIDGYRRRPYHAVARENSEALNAFLTRDLPVLTQQMHETMDLMNQLIRRQLND